MNEDISKHFSVMEFMDSNKLNMLLASKTAGSHNDYLKEHTWYKINDTNLTALIYENNGKKYAAKIYKNNDMEDMLGINDIDTYGGKKTNPKNVKNTNKKISNENPSGNGRRKKKTNDNKDYNTDLSGDYFEK
ncbi:unknown similar to AMEV098 [Adoxophyes honmai entomopoxvirus 'L']|uniref:Uncharacterized protein n=1 Tax=Adoxophyes honmai entomopoxvirus 'L' TaxID=1293540 RepID=A0A916KP30_9POXV|nr:unknown similar to AMEV098 [Adoxophyes honmai entomopoxvirus 'L']CCU55414.1 unknown similar to AMEV098 [Adoxophyes honmai entomopoxvirus 'L']